MAAIGLIAHLGRESAGAHARELAAWLADSGHEVRVPSDVAAAADLDSHVVISEADSFAEGLDLVVSLGGDGSMLRAVELVGAAETPVLGVDHGRLGYLTEVRPADARGAVEQVLRGEHGIEERMLLAASVRGADQSSAAGAGLPDGLAEPDGTQRLTALNEVVVERSSEVNTIRLRVDIDGHFFTTYAVDGMIVSTPTGSTAYAFSARGPIVDPTHDALLITPISPHMLFDRSLVLAASRTVRITVDGHRPATVSVDGRRVAGVGDGASIECSAAAFGARFVTLGARPFHHVLKEKFGLNDR